MQSNEIASLIRERTVLDPAKKGKLFEVTFRKRTDGSLRLMRARLNVQRDLTGDGLKFNPADRGLLGAWEAGNGYRMIPLDAITRLRLPDGHKHLVPVSL